MCALEFEGLRGECGRSVCESVKSMRKCVFAASRLAFACVLSAAASIPAGAADLGNYDRRQGEYGDGPIVVPRSYFSWTGFYIGGHLGYGWGSSSSSNIPDQGSMATPSTGRTASPFNPSAGWRASASATIGNTMPLSSVSKPISAIWALKTARKTPWPSPTSNMALMAP